MKRFLLLVAGFVAVLLVVMRLPLVLIPDTLLQGDLARLSATPFRYTRAEADTSLPRAHCIDVWAGRMIPRKAMGTRRVAVFGDSFSIAAKIWPDSSRWHQYMGGQTGQTVVCVSTVRDCSISVFLSYLTHHREMLPDTVFVESIERKVVDRLCGLDFGHVPDIEAYYDLSDSVKESVNWIGKSRNLCRALLHIDNQVFSVKVDRDLFSCRPDMLYCVFQDTVHPKKEDIVRAIANYRTLDSLASAKGVTMYFVPIPDKFTVYRPYVVDEAYRNKYCLLEDSAFCNSMHNMINPLPVLREFVERGETDVFHPDDTHFSPIGAKAVGLYVLQRL